MNGIMVIFVSTSTNPDTAHIGRYFLDIRDQSRTTQDPRGRQIHTIVTDDPYSKIAELTRIGVKKGVIVTYEDETGEGVENW